MMEPTPVYICTGLPVAQAYNQEGNANKELIDQKIRNLHRPVTSPGLETATIKKNCMFRRRGSIF
mgnify:CR=1 FL=1